MRILSQDEKCRTCQWFIGEFASGDLMCAKSAGPMPYRDIDTIEKCNKKGWHKVQDGDDDWFLPGNPVPPLQDWYPRDMYPEHVVLDFYRSLAARLICRKKDETKR